jgi:hypothetical protein
LATNNSEQIVHYTGTITDKSIKETTGGKNPGTEFIQIDVDDGDRTIRLRAFQPKELVTEVKTYKVGDFVSVISQDKPNSQAEGTFFHNIQSISGATPSPTAEAPRATTSATATATATWGSLDERIAWNSAINNAVTAIPWISNMTEDKEAYYTPNWLSEADTLAQDIYALIRRGPTPPVENEPEDEPPFLFEDPGEEVIEV